MSRCTATPFNPAEHGTSESDWQEALKDVRPLSLPLSRIVVVSPHPDDEMFGAGGLIGSAVRAGLEVVLLSVTDGEAAFPDWQGLGELRRREVQNALRQLTPGNVSVQNLNLPDGRVNEYRAPLFEAVVKQLSRETLLVSPFEHDGHPDHDACGEVCRMIARLHGVTLWRYPIWLWHHGASATVAASACWGRFMLDAEILQAKVRALDCFNSQLRPTGRDPIVPQHVLPYFQRRYEAFAL